MDGEDFAMPSPKRQRTNSPDNAPVIATTSTEDAAKYTTEAAVTTNTPGEEKTTGKLQSTDESDHNEILDVLMQHVESEVMPTEPLTTNTESITATTESVTQTQPSEPTTTDDKLKGSQPGNDVLRIASEGVSIANTINVVEAQSVAKEAAVLPEVSVAQQDKQDTEGHQNSRDDLTDTQRAALQVDAIPPTEVIEPVDGEGEPEWEVDSSPYESSTDSDSTDSSDDDSDDDDEDADGDYAMLDPEEAARILMQGDAGSDDEGERSKTKGEGSGLRTANEQFEDVPLVPEITITEDMKTQELGSVEAIVENNVLIRGKTSGEYQVLESGSLLCLQSRAIAGVVAETLGRVEQPLYTVRFRNEQEIKDRGLFEKGTIVYYVPQHSSFVFTQPLKAFKGSDASNFHDEEVGDEEMEFSDDEAEAEHKRQMKLKRQGRLGDSGRGRGSGRNARGSQRGGYKPSPLSADTNGAAYGNGSIEMNYDDVEEGEEEGYTPLARPNNLHEMISSNGLTEGSSAPLPPPPFTDRGRGRGHHRGRGQDRNHRGRGNFRGKPNNNNRGGSFQQNNQNPPQYQQPFPNPFPQGQYPYSQPPAAPSLTPQNSAYPYSTVTSPISPLPVSQFNFGAAFQAPLSHSPTFQQQQWAPQMPAGFVPQFNNPALLQFAQQFQQQQQHHQQQPNGGWQVNQAAAAEVQRQLDEMRRAQGGGQ